MRKRMGQGRGEKKKKKKKKKKSQINEKQLQKFEEIIRPQHLNGNSRMIKITLIHRTITAFSDFARLSKILSGLLNFYNAVPSIPQREHTILVVRLRKGPFFDAYSISGLNLRNSLSHLSILHGCFVLGFLFDEVEKAVNELMSLSLVPWQADDPKLLSELIDTLEVRAESKPSKNVGPISIIIALSVLGRSELMKDISVSVSDMSNMLALYPLAINGDLLSEHECFTSKYHTKRK
ncbi:isoprenyl transferase [Striga asiatica]|uniref:Isoprenyl transferase n=1 Tax=Striga asiatica TaxID=4170 RepID=A0A5A7R1L9_STRAF|nr:isoprenyl transferase [Striga asiatica]